MSTKIRGVDQYETKEGTRWRGWYSLRPGHRGSRSFLTQAAAVKFRRNYERLGAERALAIDDDPRPQLVTCGQALPRWLSVLTGQSAATRHTYDLQSRRSWMREFEDVPVAALSHDDVSRWVNKRLEAKPNGQATVRQELGRLSSVMADCIRRGEITTNPCDGIKFSKSTGKERPKVITQDEFERLLEHIPTRHKAMVKFMGETGVRWGEATGLPWRSLDLETGVVHIFQAWKSGAKGERYQKLGDPKTPAGVRTFRLWPDTLVAMQNHYAVSAHTEPDDLVWPGTGWKKGLDVSGINHTTFMTHAWNPAREKAKLPDWVKPHTLRHSHISWLLANGTPTYLVTRKVGHETTAITEKVYGHWVTDLLAQTDAYETAMLARRQPQALGS